MRLLIEAMTALGIALIVVALALFLAEAHLSTGGIVGVCASIAAVAGAAVLLLQAGASPAVVAIVGLCVAAAAVSLLALARGRILRSTSGRPRTGREALVGHLGVVRSIGGPQAQVFVDGSLWRAEPSPIHEPAGLHEGERVVVESVNGLTLRVRSAEEWELAP